MSATPAWTKLTAVLAFLAILLTAAPTAAFGGTGPKKTYTHPPRSTPDYAAGGSQVALNRLVGMGLVRGVPLPDGSVDYRLNATATRAEFVTLIAKAMGQEETAQLAKGAAAYPDTSAHWASGYIAAASALARRQGFWLSLPGQPFRPDQPVTLSDALIMLMKVKGGHPTPDAAPGDWLKGAYSDGFLAAADATFVESNLDQAAVRSWLFYLADRAFYAVAMVDGRNNTYTYFHDQVGPQLTVDPYPTVTDLPEVVLTGTVEPGARVVLQGRSVKPGPDGRWTGTATLVEGQNTVDLMAEDLAGNWSWPISGWPSIERVAGPVPRQGGTMWLAMWNTPGTNWNPIYSQDTYSENLVGMLYEGLWRYDASYQPVPALADSWSWDAAGTTLTLHLRPGARFHDGKPVTAADVVFTYKAIWHPKYLGPRNAGWEGVLGWSDYTKGLVGETPADFENGFVTAGNLEGLKALDAQTVVFKLSTPNAPFLYNLAYGILDHQKYATVPVQNWGTPADPNHRTINGNGAYRLEEYVEGQYYRLSANPDYWAGRPLADSVVWRVVDSSVARGEMEAGSLDFIEVSPPDWDAYGELEEAGKVVRHQYAGTLVQEMLFNTQAGPAAEKAVRLAITHAIDRMQIIGSLMGGHAYPMYSPIHPLTWAHPADLPHYDLDLTRARQLLDTAGWTLAADGFRYKDGKRLTLRLIYPNVGNPVRQATAPVVQNMLGQVGIEVVLVGLDWNQINTQVWENHDFDLFMIGFSLGNLDPDPTGLWDKASTAPGGYNASGWWTDTSEKLIKDGLETTDPALRKQIYAQWARHWVEEAPAYIFYTSKALLVSNPRLQAFQPGPQGTLWNLEKLWLYTAHTGTVSLADANGGDLLVGDCLTVTVTDADRNVDPAAQEDLKVFATSTVDYMGEQFQLTETASDTGVFQGEVCTVSRPEWPSGLIDANPGTVVTVTYTDPRDATHRLSKISAAITLAGTDTAAPTLVTAEAEYDRVTLTFSEPLDPAAIPAAGDFVVTFDGRPVEVYPESASVWEGNVFLTLKEVAPKGRTVRVSYTPGATPIQDTAGNDAAAFAEQTATNLTWTVRGIYGRAILADGGDRKIIVGIRGTFESVPVSYDNRYSLTPAEPGTYDFIFWAPGYLRAVRTVTLDDQLIEMADVVLQPGDMNDDAQIDTLDLQGAAGRWLRPGPQGDYTGDGRVDLKDMAQVARGFGQSVSTTALPANPGRLFFDHVEVLPTTPPVVYDGHFYISFRTLAERYRLSVTLNNTTQTLSFRYWGSDWQMVAGGPVLRDGIELPWDAPLRLFEDGYLRVPLDLLLKEWNLFQAGGPVTGHINAGTYSMGYMPPLPGRGRSLYDDPLYLILASGAITPQQVVANGTDQAIPVPAWVPAAAANGKLPPPDYWY